MFYISKANLVILERIKNVVIFHKYILFIFQINEDFKILRCNDKTINENVEHAIYIVYINGFLAENFYLNNSIIFTSKIIHYNIIQEIELLSLKLKIKHSKKDKSTFKGI